MLTSDMIQLQPRFSNSSPLELIKLGAISEVYISSFKMHIFAEIAPDAAALWHPQEVGRDLSEGTKSFTCNSESVLTFNYPCDLPVTVID